MSNTQHSTLKTLSVDTCTFMNEILEDINDSSTSAGAIKVEIQRKFQLCKNTKHYQVQPQCPDDFLTKGCRHRTGVLLIPFSDISSYFFRGGGPPNIFGPPFLFSPFFAICSCILPTSTCIYFFQGGGGMNHAYIHIWSITSQN